MKVLTLQDKEEIDLITKHVLKSRKVITLTGAGISCNAGIPDFRSSGGLYQKDNRSSSNTKVIKGKELFDISLFRDELTIEMFCKFMENLYTKMMFAKPTKVHHFMNVLKKNKKLIRCYTQNIDGLERKCNLNTGNVNENNWKDIDVVQLHGDLNKLTCINCFDKFDWGRSSVRMMRTGDLPECPTCMDKRNEMVKYGKRVSLAQIGLLRPAIILYGENHPDSERISKGINSDLRKNPNLFLIFGTSLRVDGVKRLVKQTAKMVHDNNGIVVFINKDPVSTSSWQGIIDYQVITDCDEWITHLESEIPQLFNPKLNSSTSPTKKRKLIQLDTKQAPPQMTPLKRQALMPVFPNQILSPGRVLKLEGEPFHMSPTQQRIISL